MPTYNELIKQSQDNVNSLRDKLSDIDTLLEDINNAKKIAEGIPEIFNEKFQELVELSGDYTNTLGAATKKYLDGNNTLFTTKLSELSTQINNFVREIDRLVNTDFTKLFEDLQEVFIDQTRDDLAVELKKFDAKSTDLQAKINLLNAEITRLVNTDFTTLFEDLQKVFIDQTRDDLAVELEKFDAKSKDLQTKIDALKTEITRLVNTDFTKLFKELQKVFIDQTRTDLAVELKKFDEKSKDLQTKIDALQILIEHLEKIDLERHFRGLQRTLADIFNAVNGINTTLTTVIQTLNGIVQSINDIQNSIAANRAEINQRFNTVTQTLNVLVQSVNAVQTSINENHTATTRLLNGIEEHLGRQDIRLDGIVQSINAIQTSINGNHTATTRLLNGIGDHLRRQDTFLENKIKSLLEQNQLLKSEMKINRAIQIVGLILTLGILIYIAFGKYFPIIN